MFIVFIQWLRSANSIIWTIIVVYCYQFPEYQTNWNYEIYIISTENTTKVLYLTEYWSQNWNFISTWKFKFISLNVGSLPSPKEGYFVCQNFQFSTETHLWWFKMRLVWRYKKKFRITIFYTLHFGEEWIDAFLLGIRNTIHWKNNNSLVQSPRIG